MTARRASMVLILAAVIVFGMVAPRARAQSQLLDADAGFELSPSDGTFPDAGNWKDSNAGGGADACCTTTAAHSGTNGLWEYTGPATSAWWCGPYQEFASAPGKIYSASAWIRTPPPGPLVNWIQGSDACVGVAFLDASKIALVTYYSPGVTTADSGWAQYSVTSNPAPAGTAYVRFICYLAKPEGATGISVANFDDCFMEEFIPPAALHVFPPRLDFAASAVQEAFQISNAGSGSFTWGVTANASWITGISPSSGETSTAASTITVTVDRTGLAPGSYQGTLTVASSVGTGYVDAYVAVPEAPVPAAPSVVSTDGYRLVVQKRLADGTLDKPRSYLIKGACWSPASIGTPGDYASRRSEFRTWYREDLDLLKAINANTVYTFLDLGPDQISADIFDYCYLSGIMVIVTVDVDGTYDLTNLRTVVAAYKNHPAILMWAIGNEWNINFYHQKFGDLDSAAAATEQAAQLIKSIDTSHPVASIYGEIDIPPNQPLSKTAQIVNQICLSVDVWGLNIYRGDTFGTLFSQWASISTKPMFLSEFGTDSYRTTSYWPHNPWLVVGFEDEAMQAAFNHSLWQDLVGHLSARDPVQVCLGGTVFEWNDEWWKVTPQAGGSPWVHDNLGFASSWNPYAHPDGFANEEYFGIVALGDGHRRPKLSYSTFLDDFAIEPSGCITGQVRQRGTTTDLAGATVQAYSGGGLVATATTATNGVYVMDANLPAGDYVVSASKVGYVTQAKASIAVSAGGTSYVNFNLTASGTLTGQVTEKGTTTALVGATVNAYVGSVLTATATTGADGVYLINRDLGTGSNYVVTASKTGYVPQTKGPVTVTAGQTTYLNFFLNRVCLMGQVRQMGTSTNLAGATVRAYLGSATTPSGTGITDANGIYQIGGLTTGTYTVIASKSGYVKQTKPGIAFTAGAITYVNFNLQVSGKLMGQVTDKVTGAPIIEATVSARTGGVVQATGTTVGPYGVYQITSNLPAGTYTMLSTATGFVDFGRIGIVVTAGATTYVNFGLTPRFSEYSGVNLPWINYGWDIGRNPWGGSHGGFSDNQAALAGNFAFLASHGVRVVRVFIFCDLRSGILFDAQGSPIDFDSYAIADFAALVSAAETYQLKLIPVLLDYTVADGVSSEGGTPMGEHPDLISDATKRQALVGLLVTLVRGFKNRPCILAWDLMNEPEFVTAVSQSDVRLFLGQLATSIHSGAPGEKVTVGCRNRGDLAAVTGAGLDLYQFHYYDYMEPSYPFDFPAASLALDRAVLIGECQTTGITSKLVAAKRNGYLGLLFWSLNADGSFAAVADEYKAWVSAN